jgi:hypothetical protein
MQIHELTLRQRTDEGLMDLGKKAVGSVKGAVQGYQDAKQDRLTADKVKEVTQRISKIWNAYARQLEKSRADAPPVAIKAPAKAPAPTAPAVPTVKVGHLTITKDASGTWVDNSGRKIVVPKDVAELDKRWKQQELLQAQNKQMSPASGIKEAGPGLAARAKTRNAPAAGAAPGAAPAGADNETVQISALDAYRQRKDSTYINALKQFVQKNLLSGQPYSRLQNAADIDNIIKTMAKPEMADPAKQEPLWNKLVLAASVADVLPQSLGGAPKSSPTDDQSTGKESPEELKEPVVQAERDDAGVDPATLAKVGAVLRQKFTGNKDDIGSTGDPAVDALLMAMGFKP